jgi:3-methylfumaryl-CoA hydratase
MFQDWIGREEVATQRADGWPIRGLCALLGREDASHEGAGIPNAGHWTYFTPAVQQHLIDTDGHPKRGGLLPPFPQARRMWAGSNIAFERPVRVGETVTKATRIADIAVKDGRSGQLVFLKLANRYAVAGRAVLNETQTLVYRHQPAVDEPAPAPKPAPANPDWSRRIEATPALMLRYSAVTFNAHRIHYDKPYATGEEGYAATVVQGQLVATILLEEIRCRYPNREVATFDFRVVRPLFEGTTFAVEGQRQDERTLALWSRAEDGAVSLSATLSFRQTGDATL